jgi:hypothetical protein
VELSESVVVLAVVERVNGERWCRRLAGRWINGDGGDEVRVRISGCQGEAMPVRLEGVGGGGSRARGGWLPETGGEEAVVAKRIRVRDRIVGHVVGGGGGGGCDLGWSSEISCT